MRDSRFELMRIVAMLFVVIGHISGSISIGDYPLDNINMYQKQFVGSISIIGNIMFFVISGYFIAKAENTGYKKLSRLFLPLFFYQGIFLLIGLIENVIFGTAINHTPDLPTVLTGELNLFGYFTATLEGTQWFVWGYTLTVLLFAPFMKYLVKLKDLSLVVLSVFLWVFSKFYLSIPIFGKIFLDIIQHIPGYSALPYFWTIPFGIILYRNTQMIENTKHIKIVSIISIIIGFIGFALSLNDLIIRFFFDTVIAISIIRLILQMKIQNEIISKEIIKIGSTTWGIYLIHMTAFSPFFFLFSLIPITSLFANLHIIFVQYIIYAIILFSICSIIEYNRKKITSYLVAKLSNK